MERTSSPELKDEAYGLIGSKIVPLPHEIFNIIIYYASKDDLLNLIHVIQYPKSENDFKNLLYQNYPGTQLDPKLNYLNNYLIQAYSTSYRIDKLSGLSD